MFNLMPDRHAETLQIDGMSCDQLRPRRARGAGGASPAPSSSRSRWARATVDAGPEATRADLVEAVEGAGYTVTGGESRPAGR